MLEFDPHMHAVRATYLASFIARLVRRYDAARIAFTQCRDDLGPGVAGLEKMRLREWFLLNQILGSESESLASFDRERTHILEDRDLTRWVRYDLQGLLVAADRWR